jgi:hypothetical protein
VALPTPIAEIAYVFPTLAAAQACIPIVDASLGYPKAGVNVGGGIHVSPLFVTLTYATVLAHPTLPEFAYPADAVSTPILVPKTAQLGLPATTQLDTSWIPGTAAVVTTSLL